MDIIFSAKHKLRDSQTEPYAGQLVYPHESLSRVEYILKRFTETGFGQIQTPDDFGLDPIFTIHDDDFVEFLVNAQINWEKEGFKREAITSN